MHSVSLHQWRLLRRYLEEDVWPYLWRKEMPGAREGLPSLPKEWCSSGVEMKANTHCSSAVMALFAGEQYSLWNFLCKVHPGTGTASCTNPLSQPEISFSRFLPVYTISLLYSLWKDTCSTMIIMVCWALGSRGKHICAAQCLCLYVSVHVL